MKLYNRIKKGIAVTTAVGLAAGAGMSLTACGNDKSTPDSYTEEGGQETELVKAEKTASEEKAMGRYLESEINLPEDCSMSEGLEFLEDGTLRYSFRNSEYENLYVDSGDNGETWGEPISIVNLLNLDSDTYQINSTKLKKDGGIFVDVIEYTSEDFEDYVKHEYYIDKDGSARELSMDFLEGVYFWGGMEFTDTGTLLAGVSGKGIAEISLEDGSALRWFEEGETVEWFGLAGNELIVNVDGSIHYYDLETGKPADDQEALSQQITSNENNLYRNVTSSWTILFLPGDEEDSVFYVDNTGMYRYAFGGSVVEQIIDGSLNSLGSPATGFIDMVKDSQGRFYLAVSDGDGHAKILRFEYSRDVSAVPDTELKVYSLREDSFLRQAAAVFQKKYPDIYISLETGMSGEDAITTTDALKTLNTEIMAGKGPDILILDGIPADTYVEKGLLEDISGILENVMETDGLLENIYQPYEEEDGSVHYMPLNFAIPVIAGHTEDIDKINDLKTLADVIDGNKDSYDSGRMSLPICMGPRMLLRSLARVSAGAWLKEDGTLEESAISEFLSQAYRMYQPTRKIMEELAGAEYDEYDSQWAAELERLYLSSMMLLDGTYQLAVGEIFSSYGLSDLYSTELVDDTITDKIWNGQEENCFIPIQSVGISAKAAEKDAAELFVEFMFSQDGQRIGTEGLPVNQAVYEDMDYWKDAETDTVLSTSSYGNATGEMQMFETRQASDETIRRMQDFGKTLDKPSAVNEFILSAVSDHGKRYLNDEISLDEAVEAIIQEVNLYLSE